MQKKKKKIVTSLEKLSSRWLVLCFLNPFPLVSGPRYFELAPSTLKKRACELLIHNKVFTTLCVGPPGNMYTLK